MKIFITGADGFIGSHLSPRLEQLYDVYKMTSDLRDHKSVYDEVQSVQPDVIIHLAARTEVEQSFYEQITFSDVNYVGTVNLIESTKNLKKLPIFIFASTMEVYGWQPISDLIKSSENIDSIPAFDEQTPANPNAPYAVAKYACEKYLEYAQRSYGLPYIIIRQTNSYGRKDNDFFVTEQIITQMLRNPNECNLGHSKPYRNFLYIDDLIDAWTGIVDHAEKCKNNIFTLGPNEPVQIKQHAQNIANLLNWTGKINWDTKPARPGEIYLLNTSNEKITNYIGWKPQYSYYDGLTKTIEVWKQKIND